MAMATAPPASFMSADELRQLLVQVIAGVAGGTKAQWSKALGPVERLPTWLHVRHNWRVACRGTDEQRDIMERAIEVVRAEHPYIH